jgi:thiol:disulfide interchange protein DsbC
MRKLLTTLTLLACAAIAAAAPATPAPPMDAGDFIKRVNDKFPATVGAKFAPAFPGFWSIVKGNEILFVREDLSVLIPGDVIDLQTNHSMAAALRAANKPHIVTKDLDTRDAIKVGSGSRRLYVFSDPDCPYCKQLEAELAKLSNVQIFMFPFPLVGLHANARVIAESIWCQEDRGSAWRNYVLNGIAPASATCDNPISRNLALGERLQIMGTPALIFEDGTVIPGAVGADRIEAQLAALAVTQISVQPAAVVSK